MIQRNNNLSVLPFYTSRDEQTHRRTYSYGEVYPLYTPVGYLPPFQIVLPHSDASFTSARLYDRNDQQKASVLSGLQSAGLTKMSFVGYDYDVIVMPSSAGGIFSGEGQYWLRLELSDGTVFYSDIFTAVGQSSPYLKIEWWDAQDFLMDDSRIVYVLGESSLFKNRLYLDTQLGKPDYEFEEEGEQRDGYFFPEKQISQKKFKCVILASEALCDAIRLIRLSDYVKVTDRYGNIYRADTFLATPKWEAQGNLASVEIEFTCDTVAKKIPRPLSVVGDFNNDYNDDFFNS